MYNTGKQTIPAMNIPRGFPVLLLVLTITILQIDYCYGRRWHHGFDTYETSAGTTEYFTNSIDKPVKKSTLEKILIYLRDTFSKSRSREIPDSMKRELEKYTVKIRNAAQRLQENHRSGRVLHTWLDTLTEKLTEIGEYVVGDMEYTGEQISEAIFPSYEIVEEHVESLGETLRALTVQLGTIVPGTLWCGAGNVADANDEVGFFDKMDSCCSDHDLCSFNIGAGKRFGPLVNDGLFTKSACFCDRAFYECLKRANDLVSIKVGITYFTLLSPQCIGRDHLKIGCRQWERDVEKKCITPTTNTSTIKELQWFSSPDLI